MINGIYIYLYSRFFYIYVKKLTERKKDAKNISISTYFDNLCYSINEMLSTASHVI